MNKKLLILIFVCMVSLSGIAQGDTSYALVKGLDKKAADGKLKALRDLGSLLDSKEHTKVKKAIQKRLLIKLEEEALFKNYNREAFLSFFYENEDQFKYSPILKSFYLSPIENWAAPTVSFEALKGGSPSIIQLMKLYEENSKTGLQAIISKKNKEAVKLLQQLLKERQINKDLFLEAVERIPIDASFEAVVDATSDGFIEATEAARYLSGFCLQAPTSFGQLVLQKHQAGDFHQYRLKGFESRMGILAQSFAEEVDFFALVMAESPVESMTWRYALDELILTRHPRALFYLKCQAYLAEINGNNVLAKSLEQVIVDLTRLNIKVEGDAKAGLVYWAQQYSDYNWDADAEIYINKKLTKELFQSYDRLFRRLSAKDGEVALNAYRMLTKGEPAQIEKLSQKYREVLRSIHPSLPSFRYKYLEQLVSLNAFAKSRGMYLEAKMPLIGKLEALRMDMNPQERVQLEDEISLIIDEAEAIVIEYEGLLYSNNPAFTYSVSRILDLYYAKNWNAFLSKPGKLEAYLTKGLIFEKIGTLGTCNQYFNRLDISDEQVKKQLKTIKSTSVNVALINRINDLLSQNKKASLPANFWETIDQYTSKELRQLPEAKPKEMEELITLLYRSDEQLQIKNWMAYLKWHPRIEDVPVLMEMLEVEGYPEQALKQDLVVKILEKIYQFSYPKKNTEGLDAKSQWLEKWNTDKANYKSWGQAFYAIRLKELSSLEKVDIKTLNAIVLSDFYKEGDRGTVLKTLAKLDKMTRVTRLKIKPKLSVSEAKKYLGKLDISYKKLDGLTKIVQNESSKELVDFIWGKMVDYSDVQKGYVINKLFKQPWFNSYVNGSSIEQRGTIMGSLIAFSEQSDFLGEYEEYQLYWRLFNLENQGKRFELLVQALTESTLPDGAKALILRDLLSRVQYESIVPVIQKYELLEKIDATLMSSFLSREFGLPLFDLDDEKKRATFLKNIKKLDKKKLYEKALTDFGLDFKNKKGKLDFEKIYQILIYDSVEPFANTNGGRRDYYVYGIIKLLEIHFETRLGFHEKLNEDQLFYTFTAQKRAKAWRQYLIDEKLVNASRPVSFYD